MALDVEMVGDGGVKGEEALRRSGRLESNLLPLAASCRLSELRDRGVLILGSGNVVHNLRTMRPGAPPLYFALEFDTLFAERLAGASDAGDELTFMTDAIDLGSVSMRSFVFHRI